jgi:hypothetical protein
VGRIQFLTRKRDFYLLHSIQKGSRAHPATYPMGMVVLYQVVMWPEQEVEHLPLSRAEIKTGGAITPCFIHLCGMVLNYSSTGTALVFLPQRIKIAYKYCNHHVISLFLL